MERRTLEIKLEHAEDLSSVKFIGKMAVYAVVSVSDEHNDVLSLKNKSPVDHEGDTAPTWNFPMKFKVDEAALKMDCLTLRFKLVCRWCLGDTDVGDVEVSLKDLFDHPVADTDGWRCMSQPVRKPDGIPQGRLSFSYKFTHSTNSSCRVETIFDNVWVAAGARIIFRALVERVFNG
ncbi:hypothetical protein C2S52_014520 [Perilla frutescens var. hirtella]|nr:hypothetical protein C2S52_014520 [Perilla frutescens var. hirtella]KAH6816627.1 hypothetical protein C2S51_021447 [Perilla frutescens var. frutescens]